MGASASRIETVAQTFFAAIEAGDLDAATALYHPQIRIWHSRDEAETDIEQNREILRLFFSRVSERRYEILRRHVFEGGFVQEHLVHGVTADGARMRLQVCFLAHLDDEGRITRIAEYLNHTRSPLKDVVQHAAPALA